MYPKYDAYWAELLQQLACGDTKDDALEEQTT